MIKICIETGSIGTIPRDVRGLILWKPGHIGVNVGGGRVVEARGFSYGVVETAIGARGWKKWGALPENMISYGESPAPYPLLKIGMRGESVELLQLGLIRWNAKALPKWGIDGDFGDETRAWVRKFQKAAGIEIDGICGPETWGALKQYMEGKT